MHTLSRSRRRAQGLTLLELLIASTLGLIAITALIVVFTSSNQNYRQNEALSGLQDNARFALDAISRDLAMAGYWGGVRAIDAGENIRVSAAASGAVSKTGTNGDCGPSGQAASFFWLFDTSAPIVFRNHTVINSINVDFRCLLPANIQASTDVLAIRRVSGAVAASSASGGALTVGRFYVKTNRNIGSIFRATSTSISGLAGPNDCPDNNGVSQACQPTTDPVQVIAYTPQIYYIRNYLRAAGDGIPILCRRYLNDTLATPVMEEDCLAEGVENLQIEWGIGSGTGSVDNYLSDPTAAQLRNAYTARIHILVRSTATNVQASSDTKTFTLADLSNFSPTPATGVLRRSFTTTVQLKNLQP